ncbi:hypothetical protein AB6A40_001061 [Gnathostoma spinigerum]|uniref:Uncharacterized protein n=1 Tax=Gnathostoma spinigerum TaxID=75299 RepID=A0ABD6E5G1_9BILA
MNTHKADTTGAIDEMEQIQKQFWSTYNKDVKLMVEPRHLTATNQSDESSVIPSIQSSELQDDEDDSGIIKTLRYPSIENMDSYISDYTTDDVISVENYSQDGYASAHETSTQGSITNDERLSDLEEKDDVKERKDCIDDEVLLHSKTDSKLFSEQTQELRRLNENEQTVKLSRHKDLPEIHDASQIQNYSTKEDLIDDIYWKNDLLDVNKTIIAESMGRESDRNSAFEYVLPRGDIRITAADKRKVSNEKTIDDILGEIDVQESVHDSSQRKAKQMDHIYRTVTENRPPKGTADGHHQSVISNDVGEPDDTNNNNSMDNSLTEAKLHDKLTDEKIMNDMEIERMLNQNWRVNGQRMENDEKWSVRGLSHAVKKAEVNMVAELWNAPMTGNLISSEQDVREIVNGRKRGVSEISDIKHDGWLSNAHDCTTTILDECRVKSRAIAEQIDIDTESSRRKTDESLQPQRLSEPVITSSLTAAHELESVPMLLDSNHKTLVDESLKTEANEKSRIKTDSDQLFNDVVEVAGPGTMLGLSNQDILNFGSDFKKSEMSAVHSEKYAKLSKTKLKGKQRETDSANMVKNESRDEAATNKREKFKQAMNPLLLSRIYADRPTGSIDDISQTPGFTRCEEFSTRQNESDLRSTASDDEYDTIDTPKVHIARKEVGENEYDVVASGKEAKSDQPEKPKPRERKCDTIGNPKVSNIPKRYAPSPDSEMTGSYHQSENLQRPTELNFENLNRLV